MMSSNHERILYVAGGRSFLRKWPGRKISSIIECWNKDGRSVEWVCGGDIESGTDGLGERRSPALDTAWYRRIGLLDPVVRSISERRDIRHDAQMFLHLRGLSQEFKPTLVWERSCRLHSAGLRLARERGIPHVLEWKDHLIPYSLSWHHGEAVRVEEAKNREADFVVVESEVLRNQLSMQGVAASKILVAHNAVSAEEFAPDATARAEARGKLGAQEDEVLVGYLGSYAFYHDTVRLVLAARELLERGHSKVRIIMVGRGKEYRESVETAGRLGVLGKNVFMVPEVPPREVPAVLSALDIAVLPGSTDIICPIKVQEYMAAELPTLVPDYPCNREVVTDGKTGALFVPRSAEALASRIIDLAQDTTKRRLLGANARREVIARFSWKATWGAALAEILRRLHDRSWSRTALSSR